MRQRLAVAITALAVFWTMASGPQALGPAHLDAVVNLPADPHKMGGFSGIELDPQGKSAILITDRGHMLRGDFSRQDNRLEGFQHQEIRPFRSETGLPVRKKGNDSEGAARHPDGGLSVSFEGYARILYFPPDQDTATRTITPGLFDGLRENGGLEALAIDAAGQLYALAERPTGRRGVTRVFQGSDQGWHELPGYQRNHGFLPVGADFGPDGRLYVLERHFKGLGFASRVRSFMVDQHGLRDPRVILQTPQRRHGNLEGLSVWRDTNGDLRLTMVSDDNFLRVMRSQVVEYVVPKPLANKGATD